MKTTILFTAILIGMTACCGQREPKTSQIEATPQLTQEAVEPADDACISGGYTKQRTPAPEEIALFNKLTADLDGVAYTPESVATQVVSGVNYKFICEARTVTAEPQTYKAEVVIYEPLPCSEKQPRITKITKIQ